MRNKKQSDSSLILFKSILQITKVNILKAFFLFNICMYLINNNKY